MRLIPRPAKSSPGNKSSLKREVFFLFVLNTLLTRLTSNMADIAATWLGGELVYEQTADLYTLQNIPGITHCLLAESG